MADHTGATSAGKQRAKHESDAARRAYEAYQGMGAERSYTKLVASLRAADPQRFRGTEITLLRHIKQWGVDHDWRARVRAYDDSEEERRRGEAEAKLAKMNDEMAKMAAATHFAALQRVQELIEIDAGPINDVKQLQNLIAQQQPIPPHLQALLTHRPRLYMPAHVLALMWRDAIDVHRLALGAATEIALQQHQGGIRVNVVAAGPHGEEVASPFSANPNARLRADAEGAGADDADEDDEADEDDDREDGE